ncbi:hypothetical protein [Aeromonas rivipollensis]|uniref:hypothetical protein n=1 Tax=Aeromonas rivipollensis TaxID=948519 RepID=UPI0038D225D7
MSRSKPKRVKPPKRIRYKDRKGYTLGPALLKLLAENGVELGTPEAEAVMVEAMTDAVMGERK